MLKVTITDGRLSDTDELLPDRNMLVPTRCRQTGKATCRSTNLCEPCAAALARVWNRIDRNIEYDMDEMRQRAERVREAKGLR